MGDQNSIPMTLASIVPPSTFSNNSAKTTWPVELIFHMETPNDGRTKVCSNSPGHMTKMAAMLIYGKETLKIFFSRTQRPIGGVGPIMCIQIMILG